jgi:hypothetical protein
MTKARDIASAAPAPSTVSATELGYLDGVTSAIQTQLDAKTAKSTLTTTGDIYYASSANTPARLAIGSTSDVLTVVAGVPGWAAPAGGGGGKLVQLVRATDATNRTTTSTSPVDASISVSITPTSASNNILLIWAFSMYGDQPNKQFRFQITDNSNNTISGAEQLEAYSSGSNFGTSLVAIGFINAASTSARTYKGRFWIGSSGVNLNLQNASQTGQLFAIEVAL